MDEKEEKDFALPLVFAELQYPEHYDAIHGELVAFLAQHFSQITSGHQGDSYIWIIEDGQRVEIDTFLCMKHQVRCRTDGPHVQKVIDVLKLKYKVHMFDKPVSHH
jgi:hypothetical protein